ncbi:unnamed protein product, partial [Rotaria sordida]
MSKSILSSINQIITEQYQKLSSIVKDSLKGHRILIADERAKQAFTALQRIFYEFQSQKLSKRLEKRAQREYKIVRSIQRLIRRRSDIVVHRRDKGKVFYIGRTVDFQRKAEEYMLKTEAYKEITNGRCPLADNLHSVNTLLDYLSGTSLRRIVVSIHAPATLASKFLNDLLVPIYLKVAHGYITSTTKFITTDVENLYTMIPRVGALEALDRFCIKYLKEGKIGTFTIDHIMKMARLIWDTNCFAYNNKYYRQIYE